MSGFINFVLVFCLEQQYSELEKRHAESQDQCLSITKDHQKLQKDFTSLSKHFKTTGLILNECQRYCEQPVRTECLIISTWLHTLYSDQHDSPSPALVSGNPLTNSMWVRVK